jgi:hypothetical protein
MFIVHLPQPGSIADTLEAVACALANDYVYMCVYHSVHICDILGFTQFFA